MKAVVVPNQNAPSLFKNKFLNKLTSSSPYTIITLYVLFSGFLIYTGYTKYNLSLDTIIAFFIFGVLSWTLAEYILHRFVYHKLKDATYDTGLHYLLHGIHHKYPNDQSKVILPIVPSIIVASILFGIFYLIFGIYVFAFVPGFLLTYLGYMLIHYMVHTKPMPKKYNFFWKHHNIHHYQQHDRAFGVSTSLWDRVFGTMPEKNRKTIEVIVERKSSKSKKGR
jgi:sterol desaturase/sphingolipid hydroxylase (fatty acid hydroxylase superfamily)